MHLKVFVIKLLLFQSVGLFCQIDNSLWISKYFTYPERVDQYKHDVTNDVIWKTENDQVFIYQFERRYVSPDPQVTVDLKIDTVSFRAAHDSLILFRKASTDTLGFTMSGEEPLITETKWRKKTTFSKMPVFNQAERRAEFEQLLYSHIFIDPDHEGNVAFRPDHRIIPSDLKVISRYNPYWTLVEIDNEIFLIAASVEVAVCQLKSFDETGFNLLQYIYDGEFRALRFDKVDQPATFNKEDLLGKWVIHKEDQGLPSKENNLDSLSSPAVPAGYVYETLCFNDTSFISEYGTRSDTSTWELELGNEVLLLPQLSEYISRHLWKIKNLTKEKLIIERRKRKIERNPDTYFETVEFRKVE